MNRERLLFAGVVALIALWFFVLRDPPLVMKVPTSPAETVRVLKTRGVDLATRELRMPAPYGAFTRVTNERENPRPALSVVAPRDLPNIRIPTSRSVRISRLGRLRKQTAPPVEGEATIELPEVGTEEGGAEEGAEQIARSDSFTALGIPHAGRVLRIRVGRKWIKDPGELPMPGKLAKDSFYLLLALCETDPAAAQALGVTELEVRLSIAGSATVVYPFPAEINNVQVAGEGSEVPYWEGLKGYLRLPAKGVAPRVTLGRKLLEAGTQAGGLDPRLRWALLILEEARKRANEQNRTQLTEILLLELDAANRLFEHERVLELAFDHLSRFPGEAEVLEIVGTLMASASFGLPEQAEQWFAKAPQSSSAQIKRVEVLIKLDKFARARTLLESGRAGSGPLVNLLLARTALAQGEFETASTKAAAYTIGEHAAEGNLILGGVAYAQGDAEKARAYFTDAVQAEPRNSAAYSDLGLALVALGRLADAEKCFLRAEALDFENTVIPGLGRAYSKFAIADSAAVKAAEFRVRNLKRKNKSEYEKLAVEQEERIRTALAEAGTLLSGESGLEDNNPRDLLVRYFAGYAMERNGELDGAAAKYRSVIDNDHRYRIAIARLGVVIARLIEQGNLSDPRNLPGSERAKAADAHLTKAQILNPDEPLLPYILGRFHMLQRTQPGKADKMFEIAAGLPAPAGDPDLPYWAAAGRATLAYADPSREESRIKGMFNNVIGDLTRMVARREDVTNQQLALDANAVYDYCQTCLAAITTNQGKRIVEWTFTTLPRTWKRNARNPMIINPRPDGLHFRGIIDFGGGQPDPLGANSVMFKDDRVKSSSFYEIVFEGTIPEGMGRANVGVGAVVKRRKRQGGWAGIQLRRSSQGTMEVRIEGARTVTRLKSNRALNWIELPKVAWAAGPFALRIGVVDRRKGSFRASLRTGDGAWVDALETQFPDNSALLKSGETSRILTRGGGGGGAIQFYFWVEGSEGTEYQDIYLTKVKLVKGVK